MKADRQCREIVTDPHVEPVTVFIVSWGRPIYLWACLDALYRQTRSAVRFVLLDNAHTDPLIDDVIAGFERRGMFSEVVRFKTNSVDNIAQAYCDRLTDLGPLHAYIESDCVIESVSGCWLSEMRRIMEKNTQIGMLGSLIEHSDFVSDKVALRLTDGDAGKADFLAKSKSPERKFMESTSSIDMSQDYLLTEPPFPIRSPPGRLMMLRTDVMKKIGFQVDMVLADMVKARSLHAAITPKIRHRHLSLLNIYDYPDYDEAQRVDFFPLQPIPLK
ncbi:MAG: hypothetical protein P8J79_02450 [Halioglobus sp.]|nr:hypothetical protein [Halioglobus sp.]